jgi:hypothetical protein
MRDGDAFMSRIVSSMVSKNGRVTPVQQQNRSELVSSLVGNEHRADDPVKPGNNEIALLVGICWTMGFWNGGGIHLPG